MNTKLRKVLLAALFCAVAVVGANIKISGSVAFDAFPAFLAAMLMGGPFGAVVGALGHMMSAALSGFPLTLPMHLVVAAEMAAICALAGWLAAKGGKWVPASAVITFVLNGFVAPAILIVWPGMGMAAYVAFLLPLVLASLANAALALALYYPLRIPYQNIIDKKQ